MTELEVLARNIHALKELLRVAWRDLANPFLSSFERREARNQIKEYSAQLRDHFQLFEAERSRAQRVYRKTSARSNSEVVPGAKSS
jgi:hypothetical protein